MRAAPGWTLGLILTLGLACRDHAAEGRGTTAGGTPASPPRRIAPADELGDGFVAWESNRTGMFRIWTQRLDGSGLRQLTPDEAGRHHFAPHISPDGARIAYLSVEAGKDGYADGAVGVLRLVASDGGGDRVIAERARTYLEDRAATWLDDRAIAFIDHDGYTVRLDLDSGVRTRLTREPSPDRPWLPDPTLSWMTNGQATFAPFDAASGTVSPRRVRGGCQPWFTGDGVWGYWVSGAGGPIARIELHGETVSTMVRKHDPRLPPDLGYVYFPMLSRDRGLLALAASRDVHDHFRADYEILVAAVDPATLELLGDFVRVTTDPAVDRYPDVWAAPLPLGRYRGEAPFTVTLTAPGAVRWELGDGSVETIAPGATVRHRYDAPGAYDIVARVDGGAAVRGRALVRAAAPPRVLAAELRDADLHVRFDEAVDLGRVVLARVSGVPLAGHTPGDDGRSLVVHLGAVPAADDGLRIAGVVDRAERPNEMPATTVAVASPRWPASRDGLVFVWDTASAPNLVSRPGLAAPRTYPLEEQRLTSLDHDHALVLHGGLRFVAHEHIAELVGAFKRTNEISLEATILPARAPAGGPAHILGISSGPRARNFMLGQDGDQLFLRLRAAEPTGAGSLVTLGRLSGPGPFHVAVSYAPGSLRAWIDGAETLATDAIQGDFFHWKPRVLVIGADATGDRPWRGTIRGIALYDRARDAAEVRESHRRYRATLAARPPVATVTVRARLRAASAFPSLRDISPYRRALAVLEWEVLGTVAGTPPGATIRVAHWSMIDGLELAVTALRPGASRELRLERFADNPQVESDYLADTLDPAAGELWLDVGAVAASGGW